MNYGVYGNELDLLVLEQQVDALNKPLRGHMTLEEAGLEEATDRQPIFGHVYGTTNINDTSNGGVIEYVGWWSDNEDSRWDVN